MQKSTEHLWAPWRMNYILTAKPDHCVFCEIFKQKEDRTNLMLWRGENCAVLINRFPYNNGHLMVVPYRHVNALNLLEAKEQQEIMSLAVRASDWLQKLMQPHGFNIGINQGSAAGAGIEEHIHLHVVPRWRGDTNFMPVLGNTKVIPQALDELWVQFKSLIADTKEV